MDAKDWLGLTFCVVIWVPIAVGLWRMRKRGATTIGIGRQVYCCACVGLGLWLGLSWFWPYFVLAGGPREWLLAAVPGVGMVLLFQLVMPGRLRHPVAWLETAKKALHFIVAVGLLEEVWFRGIWFACFKHSFLGSAVLGSVVFGLLHWAHHAPDIRKGWDDIIGAGAMGFCFACARHNGAGVLLLGLSHGLTDLSLHHLVVERKQRFGGIATILVGLLGFVPIAAVTFLW